MVPPGAEWPALARALLGIWPQRNGTKRLDGADIAHWNRDELEPFIGYLPQDIELFDGSIAANICRFGEVDPTKYLRRRRQIHRHRSGTSCPSPACAVGVYWQCVGELHR